MGWHGAGEVRTGEIVEGDVPGGRHAPGLQPAWSRVPYPGRRRVTRIGSVADVKASWNS
ncbi:hypothetical protein [Streptosporangium sp. NPDC020145]|uniref:hypothetical protein n=1 Tax=Streptosporangium sp. NPDC020145 TaxID=3154694 RepID=UPI0034446947